jgi:hypothetical protein
MSAITHLPGSVWAGSHRLLLLLLTTLVVAAAITVAVVLLTRDAGAGTSVVPGDFYVDTCTGALPGSAC